MVKVVNEPLKNLFNCYLKTSVFWQVEREGVINWQFIDKDYHIWQYTAFIDTSE
jgi:hypothetical protein